CAGTFSFPTVGQQAVFPSERLGMGAFRIALESIYNSDHPLLQVGHPWFSILTRTGVFRDKNNHEQYPADLVGVVDTVEEAIDFILKKECTS
ncbi:hypothetical protein BHE74_00015211, partial [Ensete ventricosum]